MSYFDCRGFFADTTAAKQGIEKLENDPVIESELFCLQNIVNTAVWDISPDTEFDDDAVIARLVRERMDYAVRLCDAMMQKGAILAVISGHEDNYCSTLGGDEPDVILSDSITHSNWIGLSNLINDEFSGWLICITPELAAKQANNKLPVKLVSNSVKNDLNDLMGISASLMKGEPPGTEYASKEKYQLEYTWRHDKLPQTLAEAMMMHGYSSVEDEEDYIIFTKKDNLPVSWR